jgi:hypothetical protein
VSSVWDLCLRKEDTSLHILVRELRTDGSFPVIPEDPGRPVAVLYGPNSIIKLHKQTLDSSKFSPALGERIEKLYQGTMRVTEQLQTSEWAMVGSLGNDSLSGIIPAYHRLQNPPEALPTASIYDQRIRESDFRTQNYDKGMDRFIRKFEPDVEMSATISVYEGHCCARGRAVYCTREKLRCCLLDTMFGPNSLA